MTVNPKRIMEKDNSIYGLLNSIKKRLENLISLKVDKAGDTISGVLSVLSIRPIGDNVNDLGGGSNRYRYGYIMNLFAGHSTYPMTIGRNIGAVDLIFEANTGYARFNKLLFPVQAPTATAPAYVNGGLYFDTTFNKLMDGGAALWEQIISRNITPQVLTGAGAANITTHVTHFVTAGIADAVTLADGVEGQEKVLLSKTITTAGHTTVVTPTSLAGWTTITFDAIGDVAHLLFTNAAWHVLGTTATLG